MPRLNQYLSSGKHLSSKAISQYAREHPEVVDLSIGEPHFGPPPVLQAQGFSSSSAWKHYEHSRGSLDLRQAIAAWYASQQGLQIDPEKEILVTHGGMEALNVAILATTNPGEQVAVFDPGYAMYTRMLTLLGRHLLPVRRQRFVHEFESIDAPLLRGASAVLVNSPENPTGYVASDQDWNCLAELTHAQQSWIIHDEAYDTLAMARPHRSARSVPALAGRSILVNSCSKKFGVPGLRIGWVVADAAVIDAAAKAHEALCLSVNVQAQQLASLMLRQTPSDWIEQQRSDVADRLRRLTAAIEQHWELGAQRATMGGLFVFPEVSALAQRLPMQYRQADAGSNVVQWLLRERGVAAVPGLIYGEAGQAHIRLTLGGEASAFNQAIQRLSAAP
ncbi:pyridoxal phosphate-dependent aminotransferase [Roseateles sp. DB2]|uniref:pyridoxal phosphate-dependent aminotransferase n=1 Tax=Roseateles sp. DB2 TaxID=3453717 RepID=UPI003EEF16B2